MAQFLTATDKLAEQVDQAALFGAIQAVVSRIEIADQGAGKRLAQNSDDDVSATVAIDEKQGQTRIAKAPGPGGLTVDAPASFIPLDHSDFSGWVYLTSSEAKIELKPIEPRNPWVDALGF
jgi:hypothetical protein